MSDFEITPTKRKASSTILSSNDEIDNEEDNAGEQLKKTKRKIKRKLLEDSSEEEQPKATPSKIQIPVQINPRRTAKRLRTKFLEESSDEEQLTPPPSKKTIYKERLEKLCSMKKIKSSTRKRLFPQNVETSEKSGDLRPNASNSDTTSDDENQFINDEESDNRDSYSSSGESKNTDQEYKSEDENVFNGNDPHSYANPYMIRNDKLENEDIMRVLSKSTEKDRKNSKKNTEKKLESINWKFIQKQTLLCI